MTPPLRKNVDEMREAIFRNYLSERDKRVIYFNGWDGLGASVVLRSIAEALPSRKTTPELCFDTIIHIDCSDWKSRRALQRAIGEELDLASSIMDILDKQDEEDDFNGVDESSRNEMTSVSREINQFLKSKRFVLIFHNGCDNELVDLINFGVPPITSFGDNFMIWTYRRRMLSIKDSEQHELLHTLQYTHRLLSAKIVYLSTRQLYAVLQKEAAIIVAGNPCIQGVNPMMVVYCCLYNLFLRYSFDKTGSDWDGLASSYRICDGILPKDIEKEISDALHREIRWDCDDNVLTMFGTRIKLPFLVIKPGYKFVEGSYRWISITSRDREIVGMQTLPVETTSFFLAFQISDRPPSLPICLFEHSSNLGVLILACCAFNFALPPFLKCHSIRFLGLDQCTDDETAERENHTEWVFLHSLWVLDLRYTVWDEILSAEKMDLMDNLMELSIEGVCSWQYTTRLEGRLPNLQRLRIIKPTRGTEISTDPSNSFVDKAKLEILDLSGNSEMKILPNSLSEASSLQVLILDGCNELKNVVVPDGLPHLLKSFSFDGYGPFSHRTPTVELPLRQDRPSSPATKKGAYISKISLQGCSQLENLFVRGLPNLVELDLSGAAIKTLDFNSMVLEVPMLKRLFLLGCEHLRAIIWGSNIDSFRLKLLCIDTRAGTNHPRPCIDQNKSFGLVLHAILVDVRLARSLWHPLRKYYANATKDVYLNIHVTSVVCSGPTQFEETYKERKIGMYGDQVGLPQFVRADQYSDVLRKVGDDPMQAFPKPPTNNLDRHIQITEGSHALDSGLGEVMRLFAESLHVHDVSTSANFPWAYWTLLKQCHMERCPKLDKVFMSGSKFEELEIFWASDLLTARWICSKGYASFNDGSFRKLQHLQLRSCPRLQFVLPVWVDSFPSLETLHIIHCGYLRHIFVLDEMYPEEISPQGVSFPKLTTIHLHDLPVLHQICEFKMVAPELKTIKIRGCWGLHQLPVVGPHSEDMKKPTIEIEKDVWDALEWDREVSPDHFEAPLHSRYYKKKLPRVSVLR